MPQESKTDSESQGMRFDPPACPECGKDPLGTVDTLPAQGKVFKLGNGAFEWTGDTEIFWDGQLTEKDDQGRWLLECEDNERHQWFAKVTEPGESKGG